MGRDIGQDRGHGHAALGGLLGRRVLFLGGKGGVGKTTVAAALAMQAGERGHRCLLVSTDPAHSLGDLFDRPIGDREVALMAGLWALEIDPDAQADRHIAAVKHAMRGLVGPAMRDEIDRQMDLARLSPGAAEAAMLERVADLLAEGLERFDLVVFDTAPTGHTIRLLSLPELMTAWTDGLLRHHQRSRTLGEVLRSLGGPRGAARGDDFSVVGEPADRPGGGPQDGPEDDRAARIGALLLARRRKFHQARRLLLDPAATAFILVLNPERLPILETRKALDTLRRFGVPVAALVVNRVLPDTAEGAFLETRRAQEADHLRRIERDFADLPRIALPLFPRDIHSLESLQEIGRMLVDGGPPPSGAAGGAP